MYPIPQSAPQRNRAAASMTTQAGAPCGHSPTRPRLIRCTQEELLAEPRLGADGAAARRLDRRLLLLGV